MGKKTSKADNFSNFQSGMIVGGRNNRSNGCQQQAKPKPKPQKEEPEESSDESEESSDESETETEQKKVVAAAYKQRKQGAAEGYPALPRHHPPGAISYAYSFTPYQEQYPPPPPYGQYPYNSPPPYQQYQYPPPPPPRYQERGYGGGAPPRKAGGYHGYYGGSQMAAGAQHGYYGGTQMAGGGGYDGYYEEYHGTGYPGQIPQPNQGGYNYGMSRNNSRPLQDVNQVDAVQKHAHEQSHDGGQKPKGCAAVAAAAASSSVVTAS